MTKKDLKKPQTVRVPTSTVRRANIVMRGIRIALYLFLAFLLFRQAKAAEVTFDKKMIKVGSQTLEVEIADNDFKRSRGLMFRKELKDGKGMLFVFPTEQPLSFWMKNTLIPLSIGYFGKNKILIEVIDMQPASPMDIRPKSYPSSAPAMYALEVPMGWFTKYGVKPGAALQYAK